MLTPEPEKEIRTTPGLVSILLICWNSLRFLEDLLTSIREMVSVPHEVIFLDNGSSDESVSYVRRAFPEVRVVLSSENLGFSKGTNVAAQFARGEFYFLLNIDTILLNDIAPAVNLLREDKTIGAVGASMFDARGKRIANCGSFPSLPRLLLLRSIFWWPYRGSYGPKQYGAQRVQWVEGSYLLTRASAWQSLGGFDDRIFMYGDDVDYGRRLLGEGLVSVHMPALRYTHFVGFSLKRLPYQYASLRYFHLKFSGPIERKLADAILRAGIYARILGYAVAGAVLRNGVYTERKKHFLKLLALWDRTATPGIRFH